MRYDPSTFCRHLSRVLQAGASYGTRSLPDRPRAHEPRRPRKLLLHRREINRLIGQIRERGYTIVPVRLYLKGGRAKVEIALARGKRKYDKRQAIAKRTAQRDVERALKEQHR